MRLARFVFPVLFLALASFTAAQEDIKAFASKGERQMARYGVYTQEGGFRFLAQVFITYGAPEWKEKYEEQMASFDGQRTRWRLGKDMWTVLDTNKDLMIGKTKVPSGLYYLALEHTEDNAMNLVLLDPKPLREKAMDAFQVDKTTDGLVIPMEYLKDQTPVKKFAIALNQTDDSKKVGLAISWGPHKLQVPIEIQM
jgi:hypothetical protein